MTKERAINLGYKVIKASPFEVGLVKGNKGIKTWWCKDFENKLPDLEDPVILETIERNEEFLDC